MRNPSWPLLSLFIATRNTCGLILATSKMYPNVSKQLIIQEEQGHCIVKTDWAFKNMFVALHDFLKCPVSGHFFGMVSSYPNWLNASLAPE